MCPQNIDFLSPNVVFGLSIKYNFQWTTSKQKNACNTTKNGLSKNIFIFCHIGKRINSFCHTFYEAEMAK